MSERTKKILLVVGFVISVFVFAFILYTLFFRFPSPEAPSVETPEGEQEGELPLSEGGRPTITEEEAGVAGLAKADEIAQGGVTQTVTLTTSAVFNPTISQDGNGMNFYNDSDGRFYTVDKDGKVVTLSDMKFPDAQSVEWNKDSEKAIIEFPDGSNIVYDFEAEKQVTLPKHWEDFDFSPVTDELIGKSIALDPENRWLVIASDDGSKVQTIQALGQNENKVQVNWSPNDQVVAFADTGGALEGGIDRKVIYPVGKNQENFKGLVVEGLNFDSLWSPNGRQLLYSVTGRYSNDKPLLWIVDATSSSMGQNRSSLKLNTWVDKCTWSSNTEIYCAVPINLPPNAGLQRSLYANKPDALFRIDLSTGRTNLVGIPEIETTMTNLFASKDKSAVYYTNSIGQLEFMRLK